MRLLPWIVVCSLLGCSAPESNELPLPTESSGAFRFDGDPSSRIFHGGTIYLDVDLPPVDAIWVQEGRVEGAGELEDVRSMAPEGCPEIHLAGGVGIPGLQDAHGHFLGLGAALENVDLVGATSFQEVVARVATRSKGLPAGTWITGRGWDQSLWKDKSFPTHGALSRAVPDHPVWISRVDGHAGLANLKALKTSGLLETFPVPAPEGGRVEVDGEGRPTGLLIDTAMSFVARNVPAPDAATRRRQVLSAQAKLLSEGLVAMHDMGTDAPTLEVLEELNAEGLLHLRVLSYLSSGDGLRDSTLALYPRSSDRDVGSTLRVIGVKLYMDGAMGSRGAALLADYHDAPGEVGLLRMDAQELARLVDRVADAGLQPATHAIGDRANRIVLDVYEQRMAKDRAFRAMRPRVEHAQLVAPEDWARFGASGIVPSMQPRHATSDMRWAAERLGEERLAGAYAWRRLGSGRVPVAFGSDFPVEPSAPLLGLYAARTRADETGSPGGGWLPEQRLDGGEALAAFTQGAAFAVGEEDERGKLLPGYYADMTVLTRDPIYGPPEDLLEATVLMTVIEGEVVYGMGSSARPDGGDGAETRERPR